MLTPPEYVLSVLFILTILCFNNFITLDLVAQGNTTGSPANEITSINGESFLFQDKRSRIKMSL